jgi:AbrB family looped-hinge helix DNA binding protein
MNALSKLTERGQTTLPSAIRRRLGARAGDTLEYIETEQGVLLKVKRASMAEIAQRYALEGGSPQTLEDFLRSSREDRGWDEGAFAVVDPEQIESLLEKALEWSQKHAPKVVLTGRVLDDKAIQERLSR